MKKLISCAMLLIIATATFSQQTKPSTTLTKQDYLQKSKKQKTAAWILLGGGAALSISGLIIIASEASTLDLESDAITAGEVMNYTGLAAMLGSIPLFIASGRNRRKAAASVSIKMEKATIIKSSMAYSYRYPAVGLQIRL